MKIVLANNYYYLRGGSERVLFDDQKALLAAGCSVLPFAPREEQSLPAATSNYFPLLASYNQAGVVGKIRAVRNLIYAPQVGAQFAALLDSHCPDLIHCHNIYGRLTTAILDEARARGIPVVLTVHDFKLVCPSYLALRNNEPCLQCVDGRYMRCVRWKCHKQSRAASLVYAAEATFNRMYGKYDSVAKFLCPSHFMEETLRAAGFAAERVLYHPNALDPMSYQPQFEAGDYILYAGRLSREKGILTLLDAIEQTGLPLRIAGTGPLLETIAQRIHQRQLPVRLEGFCSAEKLSELYRGSAFSVVPSAWYENASMSILESFAYGKPVVASELGGNTELVCDGQTGKIFSAGNVAELVVALRLLWNDRVAISSMGALARQCIEDKFSHAQRTENLLQIYHALLSQRTGCIHLA